MPTAIAAWLVTAGASAAVATIVANVLVSFAISYIAQSVFGPDMPSNAAAEDPGVKSRIPTDPKNKLPVVYGEKRVAGQIIMADISSNNQVMAFIIALSEGPVEAIDKVTWENKDLNFSSALSSSSQGTTSILGNDDRDGNPTNGGAIDFDGVAYDFLDGNIEVAVFPAGGRCPQMELFSTKWNTNSTNRTMPNVAYAFVKLTYDRDNRVTGLPSKLFFNVRGRTVSRLDDALGNFSASIFMSKNPADCLIDYLINTRYGCGIPASSLDYSTFFSHKTFCNFSIDHLESSCSDASFTNEIACTTAGHTWSQHTNTVSAPRYTVNGVINTNQELDVNISNLTIGNGGVFTYNLGKFGLVSEGAQSVSQRGSVDVTFSEDNIIGKIEITGAGFDRVLNEVTTRFTSLTQQQQEEQVKVEIPVGSPIRNDNEPRLEETITLPFTESNVEAERVATVILNESRQALVVKFSSDLKNTDIQAGDVILISHDTPGWSLKEFRVQQVNERVMEEDGYSIGVEITAKEYSAATYTPSIINLTDPSPNTFFPNPFNPPVPKIRVIDVSEVVNDVPKSRLQVSWETTAITSYIESTEVRFIKRTGAALSSFPDIDWTHLSTTFEELIIDNLEPETRYHIQVRTRNTLGILGDYITFFSGTGTSVNSGSFTIGKSYIIEDLGSTNFVLIGASSNNVGIQFVATGVGTGDGTGFDTILATATVATITYIIGVVGTTDFTSIGSSDNLPGTRFTATGAATGTGTVFNTVNSAETVPLESIAPLQVIITSDTDGNVFKNNTGSKVLTTTLTVSGVESADHTPYNFHWKKKGFTVCVNTAGDVVGTANTSVVANRDACESAGGFWTGTLCNGAYDNGTNTGSLFDTQSGSILGCDATSLSRADTDNSRITIGSPIIGTPLDVTTTAGSFVSNKTYRILTVGTTNFTLIGASSNTVGIVFVATGAGSGTGIARSERFRNITLGAEDVVDAEEVTCTISNI